MRQLVTHYEVRLTEGAELLSNMEARGTRGPRYQKALRSWLELLAAYEFECEMAEVGQQSISTAVGV